MKRNFASRLLAPVVLVLMMALSVPKAHGFHRWLMVRPFAGKVSDGALVYVLTGSRVLPGYPLPDKKGNNFTRFEVLNASGWRNLFARFREGIQPIAILSATDLAPGTNVISLVTIDTNWNSSPQEFEKFLFEERLIDVLKYRADTNEEHLPGRERYMRFMKAIVQRGKLFDDLGQKPIGHLFEIIPIDSPYKLSRGGLLSVRVLFKNRPLGRVAVSCANRHQGRTVIGTARTNTEGVVNFNIDRPGDFLLTAVYLERMEETAKFQWRTYFASLTFSLPGAPKKM